MQAVLEQPDDDAPRLVYADWYEENGDEADRQHAELIRLQVERARGRSPLDRIEDEEEADDHREYKASLVREGQLIGPQTELWKERLRPCTAWLRFERGFV